MPSTSARGESPSSFAFSSELAGVAGESLEVEHEDVATLAAHRCDGPDFCIPRTAGLVPTRPAAAMWPDDGELHRVIEAAPIFLPASGTHRRYAARPSSAFRKSSGVTCRTHYLYGTRAGVYADSMRVRITGTRSSGEPIEREADVSDELAMGDSFTMVFDGERERVQILSETVKFTPEGIEEKLWTVQPVPEPSA
jgi:hypothetical protein